MNDPTDAERAAFGARLTGAIPTEPDLTSLAARAETGARRTGRVRRAGVAGVAAVAVAAVIAVPQMLGSHHVPSSNPPQLPAHPCKGTPDHQDFTKGTAVWVTFCPRRPVGHDAVTSLIPPQVLTTGTAGLVAGWQRSTGMAHSCPLGPYGGTEFTIRVGFTDGTTTRIDGATDTCQAGITPGNGSIGITPGNGSIGIAPGATVYDDLAAALGRQTASGHPRYNPPGPPLTCPRSLASPGRFNLDGASGSELKSSPMLLDMKAVEGLVCAFDSTNRLSGSGPAGYPENLRIASGSSVLGVPFGSWRHAPATSYLVTLRDRTGTWRTFTITGRKGVLTFFRGSAPGVPERIGYAGEDLLLLAHLATR